MKQLEVRVIAVESWIRLLQKTNMEVMIQYWKRRGGQGKADERLEESVLSRFAGLTMCFRKGISKLCFREEYELVQFGDGPMRTWTLG